MKVIVIATHPDDETLGCGGSLLRHKSFGDEIYWLIVTTADGRFGYTNEQIDKRMREIEKVAAAYRFDEVIEFKLPVTELDTMPTKDLVLKIREVFDRLKPEVVYLPFSHDAHSDHRTTFMAASNCVKTSRFPYVKKILMMETASETEFAAPHDKTFSPNCFVDIGDYIDKKIEIMGIYASEVGEPPLPRSAENIRALATLRGSTANCLYAESFVVLKEII